MPQIVSEIVELSVFSRKSKHIRYLLLRRAKQKKPYPGIWQFITGRVKEGENCLNAAMRELKEETGLSPKAIWLVPRMLQFYDVSTDKIHLSPLFSAEAEDDAEIHLSNEHDKFVWLTYKEAIRRLVWPAQRDGLEVIHKFIIGGKEVSRLTRIR
jgi:dATP pyrophosphohydrolase